MMEPILLLLLLPSLLVAGFNSTTSNNTVLPTNRTHIPEPSYVTRSTTVPNTIQFYPLLTRVKVQWDPSSPCQGLMHLAVNFTSALNVLCKEFIKKFNTEKLGRDICQERRCGMFIGFEFKFEGRGYIFENNLTLTQCSQVSINCEDSKELVPRQELVTYKTLTGLLLVLILSAIFLRFARPMYMSIRKRFSQKRQNRWIGPTQSQSVSYHRSQAAHPDNNMVKRQSFPGLERLTVNSSRLTVNSSREPSSNRNSDYDSYSYH